MPNSVNLKSGKYKIHLTLDELTHLKVSEILDRASRPRPLPGRRPVEKTEKARKLFSGAWQEVRNEQQEEQSLPERQLLQQGYEVVYLDADGTPVRGHLPRHLVRAAGQLARKARCPVVLAIQERGGDAV